MVLTYGTDNCLDNKSGDNDYVAWNFRAGDTVTNNDGSLPSEVSANKDMGFSVVSFQGVMERNKWQTFWSWARRYPFRLIHSSRSSANLMDGSWPVYAEP